MDKIREKAAKILCAVFEEDAYANIALTEELRRSPNMTSLDRRFLTELTYGAVKAKGTLDFMLTQYANRPLKKIPPMVRGILRLGIYQIFFMDKIPPSAAVNEAVQLTKKYAHPGTVKFVNAVLRAALREPEKAWDFPKDDDAMFLGLKFFHPSWLVRLWIDSFGLDNTLRLLEFDNEDPPLTMRTNTLKISRESLMEKLVAAGVECAASKITDEGVILSRHGDLNKLNLLTEGFMQAQDESSMLVGKVLNPKRGDFVIDAGAAPGGKTTHIAALMENQGRVLACDIHEHRVRLIADNAQRLGASSVEPTLVDARRLGELYPQQADCVLADVPCSGLGVLRRRADARWKKNADDLQKFPSLQSMILEGAAAAVKPKGTLVYSTCTVNNAENIDVVQTFLRRHEDFRLDDAGQFVARQTADKVLKLFPPDTDGFFIARMVRE